MVDNESVDKICSRIMGDGGREVESVLEKARRTAGDIIGKAEAAGKQAADKLLGEAEGRGKVASQRLLSSVNLEVKRARLRAREEIMQSVSKRAVEALGAVRDRAEYPDMLVNLVAEAAGALEGESLIVFADRRDAGLLEKEVLPSVEKVLAGEVRHIEGFTVKPLGTDSLGGVRVGVPGGKIIYDNTFEARMYRFRDEIRNIIFEEVFEPEGSEGSGSA